MERSPPIIFQRKLVNPNPDLLQQILLHLLKRYNLRLPCSIALFYLFIALLYPLSIPVFKEIYQVLQDVKSIKENALMDQSVAILIDTVFQLINLL